MPDLYQEPTHTIDIIEAPVFVIIIVSIGNNRNRTQNLKRRLLGKNKRETEW